MRLLHTSDWHLGISTGRFSRHQDHERFFEWLLAVIEERAVDVLVVAGDIFDGMQPSNEALKLYYSFLSRAGGSCLSAVVIVGGNHDSSAVLEAPATILSGLRVHVVGGLQSAERDEVVSKALIPIFLRQEERATEQSASAQSPVAVVAALPYLHEYRLGVRATVGEDDVFRGQLQNKFREIYSWLADAAEERFPQVPLFATGHLTIGEARAGDSPREVHRVGQIDALSSSIFDARISYVALGHIHRCYPVERARVWYSGSPLPMSFPEGARPRHVLLVDNIKKGSEPSIEMVTVPVQRRLLTFKGALPAIQEEIAKLRIVTGELPALLSLEVGVEGAEPLLFQRLQELVLSIAPEGEFLLVELKEYLLTQHEFSQESKVLHLEEMALMDVFAELCEARGEAETQELNHALQMLQNLPEPEFESLLKDAGEEALGEVSK
ncbi:MAG: exonuclease subunit SbcD [Polyangiaceae bacterium]|nr:exonuclease subunit SbcD [Polyangiaceae bacterium]